MSLCPRWPVHLPSRRTGSRMSSHPCAWTAWHAPRWTLSSWRRQTWTMQVGWVPTRGSQTAGRLPARWRRRAHRMLPFVLLVHPYPPSCCCCRRRGPAGQAARAAEDRVCAVCGVPGRVHGVCEEGAGPGGGLQVQVGAGGRGSCRGAGRAAMLDWQGRQGGVPVRIGGGC